MTSRRARVRAQNRVRVARHRARDENGKGIIPLEFHKEDLALLLSQALGCPFNGDDREALAAGTRELLLRLIADVTHYGHHE